jgi:penicillin-binding protein 1A
VLDGPISLPAGNGKIWSPQNYEGGFAGLVPMRQALAKSLNTVAVRLTLESGPDEVARLARTMGVRSPIRADPTIALGSSEVTPMDQALGFATIARMGVPMDPVYIERLVDFKGQELGRAGGAIVLEGQTLGALPGGAKARVLPSGIAYELADMLREVVRAGTGRKAWKPGFDRAGKTGTTNDFVDAWFVGFTPRYTVAVWIGSDTTASLGDKETGGKAALPAWLAIVEALPHEEGERFPLPDDVALVETAGSWAGIPRGAIPPQAGLRIAAIDPELPLAAFGEP